MKNIVLAVGGMTCGGCVKSVTRALEQTAGVLSVAVDLAAGRAEVEFDDGQIGEDGVMTAIEDAGYDVRKA